MSHTQLFLLTTLYSSKTFLAQMYSKVCEISVHVLITLFFILRTLKASFDKLKTGMRGDAFPFCLAPRKILKC